MKIKWLGHSCFRIDADGQALVIDPFSPGSVSGLRDIDETANVVLCSHMHGDHNSVASVHLVESDRDVFNIDTIQSYHDDKQGKQRGENIIHIIEAEGYKVVHMGDQGCMLPQEDIEKLYDCDVLLIPIGGFFTIDATQAAELVKQIKPRVTIPMHYHSDTFGYDVLGRVEDFTKYFENVLWLTDDTLSLSDELQDEIVVLDYQN